ncbi:aldo/keto reductase family oxidoreductase [Psychroserpens sp.]|uniref:aldo/keto reductase n=1 Tax=Psychroserpens sp. TaxID=2020870 RepID=UPI00385FD961
MTYSRLIAGTMTWGSWGKQLTQKDMISLMHDCLKNTITTFDHADIYGAYTTEADFGNAFVNSGIKRDEIQLISKCGIQYMSDNRDNTIKHYNYNKDYIIWSAETSLKYLKTDYLDLFLLHRPSPLMHPNEVSEAITKLKEQGKIKSFGVSNFTPSQVELISNTTEISANQIEFSLTQHSAMHNGLLDQMLLNNITAMAWSPLGSVFREDNEQTRRIHKQLGELINIYNCTEDQLLLAWILKHPANIHPIIGTTNPKRITDANNAEKIDLKLEDWFKILVASQGHKVP